MSPSVNKNRQDSCRSPGGKVGELQWLEDGLILLATHTLALFLSIVFLIVDLAMVFGSLVFSFRRQPGDRPVPVPDRRYVVHEERHNLENDSHAGHSSAFVQRQALPGADAASQPHDP